jgi:bifunctional DNA-binding transcriptional regulator/antitoxin component of YhaV-PrlF toxin-antitoxin module
VSDTLRRAPRFAAAVDPLAPPSDIDMSRVTDTISVRIESICQIAILGVTMSTISLRDRRQITLPAEVVSAAGLQTNDTLEVSVVNGVIQLVPVAGAKKSPPAMRRFLGAAAGLYGRSAEEADAYVQQQRDSW